MKPFLLASISALGLVYAGDAAAEFTRNSKAITDPPAPPRVLSRRAMWEMQTSRLQSQIQPPERLLRIQGLMRPCSRDAFGGGGASRFARVPFSEFLSLVFRDWNSDVQWRRYRNCQGHRCWHYRSSDPRSKWISPFPAVRGFWRTSASRSPTQLMATVVGPPPWYRAATLKPTRLARAVTSARGPDQHRRRNPTRHRHDFEGRKNIDCRARHAVGRDPHLFER